MASARAVVVKNAVTGELLKLMGEKKTNLITALDLVDPAALLLAIAAVGPHVCAIKLHLDIVDFTIMPLSFFCAQLEALKKQHRFLVIEDRKFADIGSVMALQIARLPKCVDIVTVHAITGAQSVAELDRHGKGLLLVHQLSSHGNLIDNKYSEQVVKIMGELKNVVGAVSQEALPNFLTFSPGINLEKGSDNAGQQYKNITNADLFIVGRGIYLAKDVNAAAQTYKLHCFHPPPTTQPTTSPQK